MINEKKVIAWIPARGGSKGIKDKNIRLLNGKPLIVYTIEAALNSKYVDKVMVSTDSEVIAKIAMDAGAWVPSLRPAELASDTSKTLDAVIYTLGLLKELGEYYSVFCLLQPTSPLRDYADIDSAMELFCRNSFSPLAAVSPVSDHPLLIRSIGEDGRMIPLLSENSTCRRQDMKDYYLINGSIYINLSDEIDEKTSFNDNRVPYIMDASHSVDIDDISDFQLAENIMKSRSVSL